MTAAWCQQSRDPGEHDMSLHRLATLIDRGQPGVFVSRRLAPTDCRRCPRVKRVLRHAARLADRRSLKTFAVSRPLLDRAFGDLDRQTKETFAQAIAAQFPELHVWLPPHRKPWMREDRRMAIFDAVAFALAFYHRDHDQTADVVAANEA